MSNKKVTGRVWKFGRDINTDLVIPNFAIYMTREEQPKHCFAANRPGWVDDVQPGDILIAGANFGVGSGRPIGDVFVDLGISAVVAESFNGLGLRNCVNAGLASLPCADVLAAFDEGDIAEIDWGTGVVRNLTKGTTLQGQALPDEIQTVIQVGGVEEMLRKEGFLS